MEERMQRSCGSRSKHNGSSSSSSSLLAYKKKEKAKRGKKNDTVDVGNTHTD
jgi:hypothetical protein